ncbi:MAG: hypothetical protein HY886_04825 [Deltaproteobacteria bacterium]|nr:hypothetical protein [Deltaproteobacteria bacterium]
MTKGILFLFIAFTLCLPSVAPAGQGNISNAVAITKRFYAKAADAARGIEPVIHEHVIELAAIGSRKRDETVAALKALSRGTAPGKRRSGQIAIIVESKMNDYIKSAEALSQFSSEKDKDAFAAFIAGIITLKEAEIKRLKSQMAPEARRLKTRRKGREP